MNDDVDLPDRGCNCLHPTHGQHRCNRKTPTGRGKCDDCKHGNHAHEEQPAIVRSQTRLANDNEVGE